MTRDELKYRTVTHTGVSQRRERLGVTLSDLSGIAIECTCRADLIGFVGGERRSARCKVAQRARAN